MERGWTLRAFFGSRQTRNRTLVQKIALSGIMLGLVLLAQFCERFMPIFAYMKINFSLVFILPVFYFAGWYFGLLLLVLRGILGTLIDSFTLATLIGHAILLFVETLLVLLMYLYSFVFRNVVNHNLKMLFIILATLVSICFLASYLNATLFLPIYLFYYGITSSPTLAAAISVFDQISPFYFGIPNYWAGTLVAYWVGNFCKFGLVFTLYFPLAKILRGYYAG